MSDPAPPPLEYQTLRLKESWLRRRLGTIALVCAVMQLPWIVIEFFLIADWRMGQRIDIKIDTACEIFFLLPSLGAIGLGICCMVRANTTPKQRILALIAIVVAGAFFRWSIPEWWQDVVHAKPGERWDSL